MSKNREWKFLIKEMLHAAERITEKIAGQTYETFRDNEDCRDIVERRLQILTEAAGRIPDDIQSKYPDIPWNKIRGMRNILAHEAFSIVKQTDPKAVWETSKSIIPEFKIQLIKILDDESIDE